MQQFLVTLTVQPRSPAGTPPILCGIFDKEDGGDVTTTPVKHRSGGNIVETIYPSLPVVGTVSLERVYDAGEYRNDQQLIATLRGLVGQANATVTEQPLDANMDAFGTPRTYTGLLTGVKDGGVDSTSEQARMWSVDIDCTTTAN
jgi:hypothetical protein